MDPLNKRHVDNFNIRPHEKTDVTIEHNFVHQKLMDLIKYIKDALKSIVYIIRPKSHPNYIQGNDVRMTEPTDCGNEAVNKAMLKFSDNVNKFWEDNTPEEVLTFFLKAGEKHPFDTSGAVEYIDRFIANGDVSLTKDEKATFEKFKYMANIMDASARKKQYKNFALRDVKILYNVFMKCMNYAVKNKPQDARGLSNLEKLFFGEFSQNEKFFSVNNPGQNQLFDNDRELLKRDDNFNMLLQKLKEHILESDEPSELENNPVYIAIDSILEDNDDVYIRYADLMGLQQEADKVRRVLSKRNNGEITQLEYEIAMFERAYRMGLVPATVHSYVKKDLKKGKISENTFEEILSDHDFDKTMSKIMTTMQVFPDVVDEALEPLGLDVQLKHAIEANIL